MNRLIVYIIICFVNTHTALSQLSPGELTDAHAHLEGISNCTQCHDLGKKVSNLKCLACHTEIQSLINLERGFHVSNEVQSNDCFDCHSEHHGRKFDAVRFNQEQFDHMLTGYELEGAHETIDCRSCHAPENITDRQIRKRENTFLGLEMECLSCHEDNHQSTLSTNCTNCHTMNAFSPATEFNHNNAKFKLKGAHLTVDCLECHKETVKNGKKFQEFSGISFNECVACHSDPHLGKLENRCSQCHTEESFSPFTGGRLFNHSTTNFTLKGQHKGVSCFDCHTRETNPALAFQDHIGTKENQCFSCHADVHESKFGNDCAKCHNEESFYSLTSMDVFDHDVTDYPLQGAHVGVDCKGCHSDRYTVPIEFNACSNCHNDYHNGDFDDHAPPSDCAECHSLDKGFSYSLFSASDHDKSSFPLVGSHLATPCFSCHLQEDQWLFRNIGNSCVDCHEDPHDDKLSEEFYPSKSCTSCHHPESWTLIDFDHRLTGWPLEGAHSSVDCRECHYKMSEKSEILNQSFIDLTSDCQQCHQDIHDNQFAVASLTDCSSCHNTQIWSPSKFDHNSTDFTLKGRHAEIACTDCHKSYEKSGVNVIYYTMEKFECINCHR